MQDIMYGIDTSNWQGMIDWYRVHKDGGKSFAFVETSDGLHETAIEIEHDWQTLKALGMVRGAYHFCRFNEPWNDQIDLVHHIIKNAGGFKLGDAICLDVEESDGVAPGDIAEWLSRAVTYARKSIAKQVVIYTGYSFWVEYMGNPAIEELRECPLWQASWGPNAAQLNTWPSGLAFWQYDGNGHCPGVTSNCDLDKFMGSWRQLHRIMRPPWAK